METPLLQTKLYIPPVRPELVSRSRLIDQLNKGLNRKLTLISAPAGFGKTTLVSDWLRQLDGPTAWVSLDESDNDPVRFLTYFAAALQTIEAPQALAGDIGKGVLSALQSPQPPPTEAVLTSLLNEIAALPDRLVLVLDDYHLIENQPIHDALTFLLEHLPPQMHLVIATREDPNLPLPRYRARGQMIELRANDLRFTPTEAAAFLNQTMGLNLSTEDITALETRTEGWITGLQLAAISMQSSQDAKGFIQSFAGSNRYVLDYLIEEVLSQQTEAIQKFLLQTSILNRLNGSLCNALTGQKDGQVTLETLERANLFIVPLDNERRLYRYHHLFTDLLRQRLITQNNALINELHSKATHWYEKNDNLSEAVHHALAGGDIKSATRLIEKGALTALENSDYKFILDSVDLLPQSILRNAPWLFIYHAWALLLTGQVEAASPKLENLDWLMEFVKSENDIQQRDKMLGNIAGLKVIFAGWMRDFENLPEYANQVRQYLPENNWIRAYCAMMMGGFFWGNGNLEAASDAFAESASAGIASRNHMVAISGTCNLAHSLELTGHLQQAVELFQDTFKLAEQDGRILPAAGYIHIELARVLYELNELDRATQHLIDGIKLCRQMAAVHGEKIGHCLLVKVQLAKGDISNVNISIRNAEQAIPNTKATFDLRGGEYPQVRLWLKENNLAALHAWLDKNAPSTKDSLHFKTKLTFTMHARVLIALSREYPEEPYLKDALDLLDELFEMAENNGWGSKVIEILCLQALAFNVRGDIDLAMAKLERAIQQAEPEGFIRTFVDEGSPMAHLLYEAVKRDISPDYAGQLLAAFPVAEPERTSPSETIISSSELVEPLSERELEVLQLIAEGLTNPEIAARLFLSLHTVKAHARSIYGKLDIHNRTQAVARARALGILPST